MPVACPNLGTTTKMANGRHVSNELARTHDVQVGVVSDSTENLTFLAISAE